MKNNSPFYISKRNKKGVFIFLIIALFVVFTPRVLLSFRPEERYVISSQDVQLMKNEQFKRLKYTPFKKFKKKFKEFHKPLTKFDPNTYKAEDWVKLGLSAKQADVVLKFTVRGIYSNEQLQKIFVIPDKLYQLVKDSTFYPIKEYSKKEDKTSDYVKKEIVLVDVNSASQEVLESIPGVGPFYAKNIIKYRDRLGGFFKKEQLLEVWKMDIDKYNSIEKYIQINVNNILKISLNNVTVEELKSHPYLNWNFANSIVKMRIGKSGFKHIEDIKESVLIDEELFEKIKPYLTL
jgi:DNA uptake protein ComE-like DNA-binding protein